MEGLRRIIVLAIVFHLVCLTGSTVTQAQEWHSVASTKEGATITAKEALVEIMPSIPRTSNMVQVQLLTEDAQTVIDTVEVPSNDANWPTPGVVVYEGEYFMGPDFKQHDSMPSYMRAPGYVVPQKENK